MKRDTLFFLTIVLLLPVFVFSQVGVNTPNPSKSFHIDGAGDNTTPTDTEVLNDFIVKDNGSVGIGTITPSGFSALEILSDKGFRLPQLSTSERDKLFTAPLPIGLMLYNTDTNCVNISQEKKWLQICCTPMTGKLSIIPVAGTELKAGTKQEFTVSGVTGATSYDWYFNNETLIPTVTTFPPNTTTTYDIPSGITTLAVKVIAKGCSSDTLNANYTVAANCTPPSGKISDITVEPETEILFSKTEYDFWAVISEDMSNVDKYKWTFVSQSEDKTVPPTITVGYSMPIYMYSYTTEDIQGTLTVTVEALGENDCEATPPISYTKVFNICKPISGKLSITPSPSSVSLVAGDKVTFTVVEDNVQNQIGGYQWIINNEIITSSGPSITYIIPSGITSFTVEVKAFGCNGSEITSGTQTYNISSPPNTEEGTFINLTEEGTTNYETLWLKGVTGSRFMWYMYLTNNAVLTKETKTNTVVFDNYSSTDPLQYAKVIVKVYDSSGVQTHERTYTNVTCPMSGSGATQLWMRMPSSANCNGYRVCAYNTSGNLYQRYNYRCNNGDWKLKKQIYFSPLDYNGSCSARKPSDVCPTDL